MVEVLIVAGAVAVLAAGGTLAYAFGRREKPDVNHAHCPRCDQRVRFGSARAGQQIRCPRCRRNWTLPGTCETPAAPVPSATWESGVVRRVGR